MTNTNPGLNDTLTARRRAQAATIVVAEIHSLVIRCDKLMKERDEAEQDAINARCRAEQAERERDDLLRKVVGCG